MVLLNNADRDHLKETLLAVKAELEELVLTKEWYVTDVLDQIESSLEILNNGYQQEQGR